ncbi:16S rRNA (guanine(966)-N(2))-methyltransferase RsmD [Candidatus Marinamargulisbacteria bacterium SCGC AAA071-K20]|nr:16S rRNA (guanine(966)-N(2))-methyltransferase RsmD [Candidatus Marinamargulisbacteria bacterium SCGC AAA071-K20]
MRIIAGKYKGRKLTFPKNKTLRPTQDRVKEAVFSIIHNKLPQSRVLDLCCGTGGISIEAISRGAELVVSVDTDTSIIRKNKELLSEEDQEKLKIVRKRLSSFFQVCRGKFDLIFFDPPWDSPDLYQIALKQIYEFDILSSGGILIVEFSKKMKVPFEDFKLTPTIHKYGDTLIGLITHD